MSTERLRVFVAGRVNVAEPPWLVADSLRTALKNLLDTIGSCQPDANPLYDSVWDFHLIDGDIGMMEWTLTITRDGISNVFYIRDYKVESFNHDAYDDDDEEQPE